MTIHLKLGAVALSSQFSCMFLWTILGESIISCMKLTNPLKCPSPLHFTPLSETYETYLC